MTSDCLDNLAAFMQNAFFLNVQFIYLFIFRQYLFLNIYRGLNDELAIHSSAALYITSILISHHVKTEYNLDALKDDFCGLFFKWIFFF